MRMKVYTESYQPFRVGGGPYIPISCELEVQGPIDLGKGFIGYEVTAPNGGDIHR